MQKSESLKKLHENFMILCWCSILYDFPVQVPSSEQHFAPKHYFLSQHDYLREEKNEFLLLLHLFI